MKNKQSGFTLVEIAIVMVIIGLLIGGVLKGTAMIENAKIKRTVADIQGAQAGYYAYMDRHKVAPAADTAYFTTPPTSANVFWGQLRTDGFVGGAVTDAAPVLDVGGNYGLAATAWGTAGSYLCWSVIDKYAQSIDGTLDDGLVTGGSVIGEPGLAKNAPVKNSVPTTAFSTVDTTYTTQCMRL